MITHADPARHFSNRCFVTFSVATVSAPLPWPRSSRRRTVAAAPELVEQLPDGRLRCYACGHRCPIPEGREGVCRVRFREDGVLRVPRGYVGALQCDPIEKKPFFHALPGSDALSFGMLGCDLHCAYCQNWFTSQSIRDPEAVGRSARRLRRRSWSDSPSTAAPRRSSRRTTSRSSPPSGRSRSFARRRRRGCARRTSRTATERPRSSTTSGPGSTSTRWT